MHTYKHPYYFGLTNCTGTAVAYSTGRDLVQMPPFSAIMPKRVYSVDFDGVHQQTSQTRPRMQYRILAEPQELS